MKLEALEYCQKLLTNREPKRQYAEDISLKHWVHSVRMNEVILNDADYLSEEMFEYTFQKLKEKFRIGIEAKCKWV